MIEKVINNNIKMNQPKSIEGEFEIIRLSSDIGVDQQSVEPASIMSSIIDWNN